MAAKKPSAVRPFAVRAYRRAKKAEYWLTARFALSAIWLLRLLPPDRALNFADRMARRFGPWFGRNRTALGNLRAAFPEKSQAEIEALASDMWGNMGRLAAEYVFLDRLFDYDPDDDGPSRIEVEGKETFLRLREENRPHIFFTAHIGNFELLPLAASTFGLPLTVLFRAPNNPYIANYIFSTRKGLMGELLASRAGAAFALARVLERGGNIGALVDQKFTKGILADFFGRPCKTNPLVAKLARQYECAIHPAHVVRLPGNRFRIVLEEALEPPRRPDGAIDAQGLTQMMNDVVERWIRADPGQWMWFHKRWLLR
jgi:Kdo2-lipid IVA lauroyltransferase/acyltransferase